jgi:monoterpene epsilon-lactone hydrolase
MRSFIQLQILFLIFAIALTMVITKESKAQDGSWEIGPRILPASIDVSDVVRESLLNTQTPDVKKARGIVFSTDEEWEAWVKEGDVPSSAASRALADALSVTVKQDKIGGVNVYRVTPPEIDEEHKNHIFIYIHGGAWVRNGGLAGTLEAVLIEAHLKMPVISIDYRMPPKYPAPAATDDVIAVWKELIKEHSPGLMAMGGTSGGGNITLCSVHRFKDEGLPVPGALYVGTPAVDIDMTGDSRFINEGVDRHLASWKGIPYNAGVMYAGEYDLKHPYVSPIYGEFSDFPPSYIISGTRDLLLSDAVRVHRKLRRAGVEADLHIYEGQSHADYIYMWNSPESVEHYAELNAFLVKHLPSPLMPNLILPTEKSKDIEVPKSVAY